MEHAAEDRGGSVKHPLPVALAGISLVMVLGAALAGQLGVAKSGHERSGRGPTTGASPAKVPAERPVSEPLVGVAGQSVKLWDQQTGVDASLAVSYITMADPVQREFVRWAEAKADGARPVIEILPRGISLTSIAQGAMDGWLRSLKAEINEPVVISFAPEADGNWYTWGLQPAAFRVAWRHVWHVIGTHDVTWLWQMSAGHRIVGYWPGQHYVTWAGLDGYLERPGNTFSTVFAATLTAVRAQTSAPILLSECAVGPGTRNEAAGIRSLFTGARRHRLIGVVWFDRKQNRPPFHQDWQLIPGTSSMAAFRSAAAAFLQAGLRIG
jgi:hypothetical protein